MPGNIAFGVFISIAVVLKRSIVLVWKIHCEKKWGIYALTSCIAAFAVWNIGKNGNPLCDPNSLIQGHAAWHLLLALAMFFLFRFYVSENAAGARRSQA